MELLKCMVLARFECGYKKKNKNIWIYNKKILKCCKCCRLKKRRRRIERTQNIVCVWKQVNSQKCITTNYERMKGEKKIASNGARSKTSR